MKNLLITIVILTMSGLACQKNYDNHAPRTVTTINLDEIASTVETVKIPVKVIYNSEWYRLNPKLRNRYIHWFFDLTEGPDSTFYVLDPRNRRMVQFDQDGHYISSIGRPGSGPGEFSELFGRLYSTGEYIYMLDGYGPRLQVFDQHGNYVRTIRHTNIEGSMFAVGKRDMILYAPPSPYCTIRPSIDKKDTNSFAPQIQDLIKDSHMIILHDNLGREIKRIGAINSDDEIFDPQNRVSYYITTNDRVDYIWCVFRTLPLIRKYDYDGNFIEEILFESESVSRVLPDSTSFQNAVKNLVRTEILANPHISDDGDLLINISWYGNVRISGDEKKSRIIKKYEFIGIPENLDKRYGQTRFKLRMIHDKSYGFISRGIIVKEDK